MLLTYAEICTLRTSIPGEGSKHCQGPVNSSDDASPHSLCCNYLTLLLQYETRRRQYVDGGYGCVPVSVLTKTGHGSPCRLLVTRAAQGSSLSLSLYCQVC